MACPISGKEPIDVGEAEWVFQISYLLIWIQEKRMAKRKGSQKHKP